MGYLIGTDEAGYGPNLGPLVISATVWEAPDGIGGEDLFGRLSHVIASRPERFVVPALAGAGVTVTRRAEPAEAGTTNERGGARVVMADSKVLYSPERGLRHLERGLWAALGAARCLPEKLARRMAGHRPGSPRRDAGRPLVCRLRWPRPVGLRRGRPALLAEALRAGLAAAGVRLLAVRSRAIFAHQFNELVERHGSKGAALSHQTLDLAARMIDSASAGARLGDLRQARRAEPLRRLAGRAFPRVVHRNPRRRAAAEQLPLRPGGPPRRVLLPRRGRVLPARRAGLDGVKISPGVGHAGLQRLLAAARAESSADCRISGGCKTFSRRYCEGRAIAAHSERVLWRTR